MLGAEEFNELQELHFQSHFFQVKRELGETVRLTALDIHKPEYKQVVADAGVAVKVRDAYELAILI